MSNPFDDTYEIRGSGGGGSNSISNDGRRGIAVRPQQQQGGFVATTTNPFDDTNFQSTTTTTNIVKPKTAAVVLASRRPVSNTTADKQQQQVQVQQQRVVVSPTGGGFLGTNTRTDNNDDDQNSWNSQSSSSFIEGNSEYYDDDDDNNLDRNNRSNNTVPAEASWQYLGDLPYRRVPIYYNVSWERKNNDSDNTTTTSTSSPTGNTHPTSANNNNSTLFQQGLATFPPNALRYHPKLLDPREVRTLFNNTTKTLVKGCPNGGPIAAMTVPVGITTSGTGTGTGPGVPNSSFLTTTLHVWTNSGKLLFQMEFPPPFIINDPSNNQSTTQQRYTASDILTMGFTNRTTLIIVLRDSYCYTINLRGEYILQPFYILSSRNNNTVTAAQDGTTSSTTILGGGDGCELLLAHIYDGGVAVLSTTKDTAIVELLDYHDDITYLQTAHPSARKIIPSNTSRNNVSGITTNKVSLASDPTTSTNDNSNNNNNILVSVQDTVAASNYALITIIPTGKYANQNFCHYCSIAVLSRTRTSSKHPEIFLSTSDNTVLTIDVSTLHILDVNCRNQILSPIIDMCFAPNGRFLACYTESNIVTVISTSFETKILDFDTSEGSNIPPLEMKWCGEDRYDIQCFVTFLCFVFRM
jgi:Vps16, N-terminal region